MAKYKISGGRRLEGTVQVSGSKNASLPILAACLLNGEVNTVYGIPRLRDIMVMQELLRYLGGNVAWEGNVMTIDSKNIKSKKISEILMRRMRASNLVLGPLLSRFGRVEMAYPGGCQIGTRPMDLHIKGIQALGAVTTEKHGYIIAEADELVGAEIHLDVPSVGATENIMMAAVFAKGQTVIRNAAREPEIVDLQKFLNSIGADVRGAGSDTIKIRGVKLLKAGQHKVIPDRIEAGTHMVAAAVTRGDITIENIIPDHMEPVTAKLKEAGIPVYVREDSIRVCCDRRPVPVDIKTMPYPGFPTDMQPQLMVLMCIASGTGIVTETVFENRYKHVAELRRMGADIRVEGQTAIVKGVKCLSGACVEATDLRAGAALVLAALAADNGSVIEKVMHIERGYESLESKYSSLGANIVRVHD
ncbi:UDP-N-acetylglucosamine1-carboxyvinyltransferase [Desulfofarcimen acetoxidans DSM 771]|uniref:UDP-N-acetylglucosamine 1-carboxyvinyltransferase n=1 Tax=Desulfofarcimen acetoxidans (strain ATCC 49208 / DSM 771 / KCTC 5769 / VKM B-1644 / 5575) TaxID=485916 RepID=C8W476_DESAS|nr:UDP-N-acetylglucosamine 1-carboxyvinyltransferase [Desulfofarcimen acetoxidans]ACV61944.1 UDP-N-acetylglucosamine1-carboxyvinyltransferase [Desulfofarcimen acetoxidans DSM 771]